MTRKESGQATGTAAAPGTMAFKIRRFTIGDSDAVMNVWGRSGLVRPNNDPWKDIQRKLKVHADLFLVGTLGGAVVATIMVGYEGHRGWINYLGVLPEHQRRGYARRLMEEAERLLRLKGCPKMNLQVRSTNAGAPSFYERVGYCDDKVVSLGRRLEHDTRGD
jgi:ribosomal protein S18 acetylase RimI-like enzyme